MKAFLQKYKTWLLPGAFLIMIIGIALGWFGLKRTITIILDGEEKSIQTASLSIPGILRSAGIVLNEADLLLTAPNESVWVVDTIQVERARKILIITPNDEMVVETTEEIPANILNQVGIDLYPNDQIMINSAVIDPYKPIEDNQSILLQYRPASALTLEIDQQKKVVYTNEATLGSALEAALIQISPNDWISESLSTPISDIETVIIRRAKPITVVIDGMSVTGLTASATVGDALLDIGEPLQNLDYSIPPYDAAIPDDQQIEVVHVNESLMLTTEEDSYENDWVEDPNALLDTISVVQPGQLGIYASRERIRYENGEEVWRSPKETWQASQAQDGVLGYGTRVEVRTEVVDGQEIEYWRKITVYATAYSPCRSGVDGCLYGTATGILPVQKGVVAVTPRWLSVPNGYGMWGQSVYIPGYGYGTIADSGGGIPGTPWIDLAYSDDDFQSWNRWTTLYFLTPVPAWYPAIILP